MNKRNLKLGYGGTKTEMERLLADAEKISGIHYDISNLNDVYSAIHVIQGELGITGTTAKEASSTIQGSAASMKAAFTNFLSGTGGIEQVIDTVVIFGENVMNAIVELAPKIIDGIVKLVNALIPQIPTLIEKLLPPLLTGVVSLVNGIVKALPKIIETLKKILPGLIDALFEGLIVITYALAEMLPDILPPLIDAILTIIPLLIENLDLFVDAGIELLKGLALGLLKSLPILLARAGDIIKAIVQHFARMPQKFLEIGGNIIKGLWNGIKGMKDWVVNKVKDLGKSILKGLKGVLGIHSPSTEFAMLGRFSILGYTEALDKMKGDVQKQIDSTFGLSPQLTGSMQNSFSPNVQVYNNVNVEQDPLGQMVSNIKTFSGGAKNDYNYGSGI